MSSDELRIAGERGWLKSSAEIAVGSSTRCGWGVRLRPAHCHSLFRVFQTGSRKRRVERYRDRRHACIFLASFPFLLRSPLQVTFMNVFELTRALVDIESITGNEENVGLFLSQYLSDLASRHGGRVERMEVEPHRFNVFAQFGERPLVTLSTHMDTVPPFFPSREDDESIWGRAACDTKGIIASMITAAERLLERGGTNLGLLFVVGEERNSAGAFRGREGAARVALYHQWRAHGEQAGARIEGRAAL